MSRPGYWKSAAGEILYTAMEESHVRHALRYCRTKIKDAQSAYWEDKIIELGNEAQRRGIIPAGDMTLEQLYAVVDAWQATWDANRPAVALARNTRPVDLSEWITPIPAIQDPIRFEQVVQGMTRGQTPNRRQSTSEGWDVAKTPKTYISKSVSIEHEIGRVTGLHVRETIITDGPSMDRRLDLDL